jgi:hypothetical protein
MVTVEVRKTFAPWWFCYPSFEAYRQLQPRQRHCPIFLYLHQFIKGRAVYRPVRSILAQGDFTAVVHIHLPIYLDEIGNRDIFPYDWKEVWTDVPQKQRWSVSTPL